MTHPSPQAVTLNYPWMEHYGQYIVTGDYDLQELLDYHEKYSDVEDLQLHQETDPEFYPGIAISEPRAIAAHNAKYHASLIVKSQVALMDRLWAHRVIS